MFVNFPTFQNKKPEADGCCRQHKNQNLKLSKKNYI